MNNRFTSFGLGFILAALMVFPSISLSAPFAYVADSFQNWVAIIDLADNTYTTVDVGAAPQNVVLHPSGAELYVTNYTDDTISFLDVAVPGAEHVYATIDEASILRPEGMTISPDGSTLYVAHADPPTNPSFPFSWNTFLTEIDIATQMIVRSEAFLVNDAVTPHAVEISPDGETIYISGRIADSVFVIDANSMAVLKQIPVGEEPRGLAVTPDGSRIFVANEIDNTVSVISSATNTVISTVAVGSAPYDVTVTPDGLYAYVVNATDATVDVIEITNNYAVKSGTGYPVDVIGEAALATNPRHITTNADGTYVYVSGYGDNTVTAILTADDTVASEDVIDLENGAEAGGGMLGIAVAPDPYPILSVPEVITFAPQPVDGSASQVVTVTNHGLAELTLGDITAAVPLHDNFVFTDDPVAPCSGAVLGYKEECKFTLEFTPNVGGDIYASFNIPSNDTAEGAINLIAVSGAGTSLAGNTNPTAPSLISPAVGTNSVDLTWNKSTDVDGDTITYRVYVSKSSAFTDGLYYAVDGTGILLAGSGLATIMLLGGALRKRNKKMIMLATLFAAVTALTACGGGGGGGGGDVEIVETTVSNLESGTRYYWKVIADDGKRGVGESSISTFITL